MTPSNDQNCNQNKSKLIGMLASFRSRKHTKTVCPQVWAFLLPTIYGNVSALGVPASCILSSENEYDTFGLSLTV